MPPTMSPGKVEEARSKIERCANQLASDGFLSLAQVVSSILTAMDYKDAPLIKSHVHAAFEEFAARVDASIVQRVAGVNIIREAWRSVREEIIGFPVEDVDELGKALLSIIDLNLVKLIGMRDEVVRLLQKHGYEIKNAERLDTEIEELTRLKANLLAAWPWSSRTLPPVNRKMVAESRAAIVHGKGMSMEEVIRSPGHETSPAE
jgi:hypothetical protein